LPLPKRAKDLLTIWEGDTYYDEQDQVGSDRARFMVTHDTFQLYNATSTSLPFGDWLTWTSTNQSPVNFTGQRRDPESGLDDFTARYFGSSLGRFMSPDNGLDQNRDNPQSWNLYEYVRNNPVNAVDPSGRLTIIVAGTGWSSSDWNTKMALVNEAKEEFNDDDVRILNWTGNFGSSEIESGANELRSMVSDHAFQEGEKLNVIAHSRGGEVALSASSGISKPIENLVTLGMPTGWVSPDMSNIKNWLNVLAEQDLVAPLWNNSVTGLEAGARQLTFSLPEYNHHGIKAHSTYWNNQWVRSLWWFWASSRRCHSAITSSKVGGGVETLCAD
jgi:RHS repeat-associated protein